MVRPVTALSTDETYVRKFRVQGLKTVFKFTNPSPENPGPICQQYEYYPGNILFVVPTCFNLITKYIIIYNHF